MTAEPAPIDLPAMLLNAIGDLAESTINYIDTGDATIDAIRAQLANILALSRCDPDIGSVIIAIANLLGTTLKQLDEL